VIFKVTFVDFKLSDWNATNVECMSQGGLLEAGIPGQLWSCNLGQDVTWARWETVRSDLEQAQYCPTGLIYDNAIDREAGIVNCIGS
jgi:hypothetical protein